MEVFGGVNMVVVVGVSKLLMSVLQRLQKLKADMEDILMRLSCLQMMIEIGPYGGIGGEPFSAERTVCYLSYPSGRAEGNILVSITLHWKCP